MTYKFQFSIITAFYNTGEFLRESIESVINQDIGFEENVQLILVDDGSSDNSKEIALEYQKLYPENIYVVSKENGGAASAKNFGLDYVEGKYVNFLDSDDLLSLNALSVVDEFLNQHDVSVVCMPIQYFGKTEGEHHLNDKFETERVIDLNKEYYCALLNVSSSFIAMDVIKDRRFNLDLVNGEDSLFINELLLDLKKFGVVNRATYNYRKRGDESSIMDNASQSRRFFTEKMKLLYKRLIDLSIEKEGEVPKFIQYTITIDLTGIIASQDFNELFTSADEIDEFWDCLYDILGYIDYDIIINHRYLKEYFKSFYVYLKNDMEFNIGVRPKKHKLFLRTDEYIINKLHNHKIHFDIVELTNESLNFSGVFTSSCKSDAIKIKAVVKSPNGDKEVYEGIHVEYPTSKRHDLSFLGIDWLFFYNFDLKIPLENLKGKIIFFRIEYDENSEKMSFLPRIRFKDYCTMTELCNYIIKDSNIVLFKDNSFHVLDYSYPFLCKLELKNCSEILKTSESVKYYSVFMRIVYLLSFVFMRKKRIWLFADRPNIADDNAMYLFRYAVNQDDGIDKYFIVEKSSTDYGKMRKISKNIIAFGSFRHKFMYMFGEKVISSHVDHEWINPFYEDKVCFSNHSTIQRCFIQHGITLHDVSFWLRKFFYNNYLFSTASDYERDSIVNGNYNYDEERVNTLGFPRFDSLSSENTKREILFAPTWRKNLDEKNFLNSSFYKVINAFLTNDDLIEFLRQNDYKLVFKPHFNLLPFVNHFKENDVVKINCDDSYQKLFNQSCIMITDYSSVAFDFAYLKKPVFYYHSNDFDEFHYAEGYFSYETMGFGEVENTEEELVNGIIQCIKNDCEMEEKYKVRVDEFFKFTDKNNCKRVYDWLYEH